MREDIDFWRQQVTVALNLTIDLQLATENHCDQRRESSQQKGKEHQA